MLSVLRFIGLLNAAVWVGGAVFFTFGIGPAVFTPEMKRIFGQEYVGYIAQTLIARYFNFYLVCGVIALCHFAAETFSARLAFRKWLLAAILAPLAIGIVGAFVLQPRLNALHQVRYRTGTPEQRVAAKSQFERLHAASMIINLVSIIILAGYTWRVANAPEPPRFVSSYKFRG